MGAHGPLPWDHAGDSAIMPTGPHAACCRWGYCGVEEEGRKHAECPFQLCDILSREMCVELIRVCDEFQSGAGGWGSPNTTRHRQYPTTDLSFADLPQENETVSNTRAWLQTIVLPAMAAVFSVPVADLNLREAF